MSDEPIVMLNIKQIIFVILLLLGSIIILVHCARVIDKRIGKTQRVSNFMKAEEECEKGLMEIKGFIKIKSYSKLCDYKVYFVTCGIEGFYDKRYFWISNEKVIPQYENITSEIPLLMEACRK